MSTKNKELFARIIKINDVDQTVSGILVAERPDMVDEIFDYASSKAYFQAWNSKFAEKTDGESVGNLRSMHTKIAAGKFLSMEYNDDTKSVFVDAKVVDRDEWEKVRERVYTGFSIGAKYVRKWRDGKYTRWTGDPYEGSLVDNPAIPDCEFSHKLADGTELLRPLRKDNPNDPFLPIHAAEKGANTEKGMGRISHLAQAIDGINAALEAADYDQQVAGRGSHALSRLHAHAKHLHDAFAAYTQEQVDEHKKQHGTKTISEEEEMIDKELREKFVQLRKQADDALKAMDDDKPDHSAEDCKDADCKYHGKSKAVPSGSGSPDTSAHGAPSVGSPTESESSNASWGGKVAGIEDAQKKADDAQKAQGERIAKMEDVLNETAALVLKISENLAPSSVVRTVTVTKAADNAVPDKAKEDAEKLAELTKSDPLAASALAIKMAQANPRVMAGGSRFLPPAQGQQ